MFDCYRILMKTMVMDDHDGGNVGIANMEQKVVQEIGITKDSNFKTDMCREVRRTCLRSHWTATLHLRSRSNAIRCVTTGRHSMRK